VSGGLRARDFAGSSPFCRVAAPKPARGAVKSLDFCLSNWRPAVERESSRLDGEREQKFESGVI
jgi:hypothetical protein